MNPSKYFDSNFFLNEKKGPIVSGLANRYGCRPIIIIGSVGASFCMALSTLSPNVWVMMLIYGIFGGIFFGMVYLPFVELFYENQFIDFLFFFCTFRSVVMVSFYFDKKRAIANGIILSIIENFCLTFFWLLVLGLVTAGTGIGALSFGPLANFLMGNFGWKTGMWIFAGIMLTCILFGAIMKPLKPQKVIKTNEIEPQ